MAQYAIRDGSVMRAKRQELRGTEVRFRLPESDHLIIVEGWVNDIGPFNFIVDTGASMTVISPSVARAAGVRAPGRLAAAIAAKGRLDARVVQLKSLRVGLRETKRLDAAVMSLAALNRSTRQRVGGIIGYNLLRRYRVTIDYSTRRIWLWPLSARDAADPL